MKNLVFIFLIILQGSFIYTKQQFNFGDIIAVDQIKMCDCIQPVYKHYAIYVDDVDIEGKNKGEDIFHFWGPDKNKKNAKCVFGKMEDYKNEFKIDNYADPPKFRINREDIIRRIKEKHNKCDEYRLLTNNCEHLATFVRNENPQTQQNGALSGIVLKCKSYAETILSRIGRDNVKYRPTEFMSVTCDILCPKKSPSTSG